MCDRLRSRIALPDGNAYVDRYGNLWQLNPEGGTTLLMRDVLQISAAGSALFALTEQGELWAAGDLASAGLDDRSSPVPIPLNPQSGQRYRWISAGNCGLMAVDTDKTLWHFSADSTRHSLTRTRLLEQVEMVASGSFRWAALTTDGSVHFWGADGFGGTETTPVYLSYDQNGNGIPKPPSNVILDSAKKGVTFVSVGMDGENGWAIDANGSLWCWGSNEADLIGNGGLCDTQCRVSRPEGYVYIPGMRIPWQTDIWSVISAAPGMAVLRDGSVQRWGRPRSSAPSFGPSPVPTAEQRMIAAVPDINEQGDLVLTPAGENRPLILKDFMTLTPLPPYSGAQPTLDKITADRGNITLHAADIPRGESVEYGVSSRDPKDSAGIRWQLEPTFPLPPGNYTLHVRIRARFGYNRHAAGTPVSQTVPIPDPGLSLWFEGDELILYTAGDPAGDSRNQLCVLAGYDADGRLVFCQPRMADESNVSGPHTLARFRLPDRNGLSRLQAFLLHADTGKPLAAHATLQPVP